MVKRKPTGQSPWELAAETIAVKIRWFGLIVGYVLVNTDESLRAHPLLLNGILSIGLAYAVIDTIYSVRGRVFLQQSPLLISLMETGFIGLLCYCHSDLHSPFRYYYFLSLICCAMRHPARVTWITCALHGASYTVLFAALPEANRDLRTLLLTLVVMGWVTWASAAMGYLFKRVGEHLSKLNHSLREHQSQLEARIEERTLQLREAQALLLHQEKMAAFGLLSAGVAHEVGNPLTSISSIVQMLQRRNGDDYTQEKLDLVSGELKRIQTTLRELINFSRPASTEIAPVSAADIVEEVLRIAKYYKRTKTRRIESSIAGNVPSFLGKKGLLVQVVLNLLLNAIDATEKRGRIDIRVFEQTGDVVIEVEDYGQGMNDDQAKRVFQPYFTTKPDGTGLGLFVTRKLVAEHGGEISFDTAVGEGTTFRVVLPATDPSALTTSLRSKDGAWLPRV